MTVTLVFLSLVGAAWYYLKPTAASTTPVPIPKTEPTAEKKCPRYHGFDVLLELKECLIAAGVPEKDALAQCEAIAPLLLGGKK